MNHLKEILSVLTASFFIIISACTSEDKIVNPGTTPPPEIIWMQKGLDTCRIYSLFFLIDGKIFAGTDKGLFYSSDNGEIWIDINQDLLNTAVTCFCMQPDGSILAGTSNKGIFVSTDDGSIWQYIGMENMNITSIAIDSHEKIFTGTRGNGIFNSIPPYDEWWSSNPDFNNQTFSALLITSPNTIFAGGTGAYRSDDNGRTWNFKDNGLGNWSVYSLVSGKEGKIYAGTDVGGFFRSTDNGESWLRSNSGMSNTEITSLAINEDGHFFSGTWRGGVYRSTNDGNDWTLADSGLTNKSVYSVAVSPNGYLFAGTFRGIFRTESKCTISSSGISNNKN